MVVMLDSILQFVFGYLLWKRMPSWLGLSHSKTVDHYIIVAMSFVGIVIILSALFSFIRLVL